VQIAKLQDRETIEGVREFSDPYVVVSHLDMLGILAPAPEQAGHLQRIFNGERRKCRILDVEKIQPLPEHLGFVVFLYAQALPGMETSNTLFKELQFVAVHFNSSADAMRRDLLV
jgi:hypothetical protein